MRSDTWPLSDEIQEPFVEIPVHAPEHPRSSGGKRSSSSSVGTEWLAGGAGEDSGGTSGSAVGVVGISLHPSWRSQQTGFTCYNTLFPGRRNVGNPRRALACGRFASNRRWPPGCSEHFRRELNESQQAAVTAPDGYNLILAGPGSGKTRVITYRVAYLIATGVPGGLDHAGHLHPTRGAGDGPPPGIA